MEDLIGNIHWAFDQIVDKLKWMDDTSKYETKIKARNVKTFIGYPEDSVKNRTKLEEIYSHVFVSLNCNTVSVYY